MKSKPVIWNGVEYESVSEAARACGIAPSVMLARVRRGYVCDNDMVRKQPVVWNGIQYPSKAAAAKACGISRAGMGERLKKGYTCDDDMPVGGFKPTP